MNNSREIWKDVPGYEGLYKVSSDGQILSLAHKVKMKSKYRKRVLPQLWNPFIKRPKR